MCRIGAWIATTVLQSYFFDTSLEGSIDRFPLSASLLPDQDSLDGKCVHSNVPMSYGRDIKPLHRPTWCVSHRKRHVHK